MLRSFARRLFETRSLVRGKKTSTRIVGLPVDPNARENLTKNLYKIKELMAQHIPETAEYRKMVFEDIDHKLKVLEENESDEAAEEILGFQLEQIIRMTEDELNLIPFLAEHRPWEMPEGHVVPTYVGYDPFETGFWEGPPGVSESGGPKDTAT